MKETIDICDFDYPLPDGQIAKFPVPQRDFSRLLVYRSGNISETLFRDIGSVIPKKSLLIFNNTKVVRARIIMHKPSGARIEVLCLEPHEPADFERSFASKGSCEWRCIVGNLKKWNGQGATVCCGDGETVLQARRKFPEQRGSEQVVCFEWNADLTFGQLLERLGRVPIPPYLGRDSEESDNTRYQTVYSKVEGSVAAPTAGLHFTPDLLRSLESEGTEIDEVTLHVGAGTFLPVKEDNALDHPMHTEHFEISVDTIDHLLRKRGNVIAVGTTSVRTLESLPVLSHRISATGSPQAEKPVGQFEPNELPRDVDGKEILETLAEYMRQSGSVTLKATTRIMITPGFNYRIVDGMITNFHQPRSTLLLLVSAFVGADWRRIYEYALSNGFRFLSYGDSSILLK